MEVWTWGRALPWMDGGPWSDQKLPIKGIFSVHLHGGVGQHSEHFLLLVIAPRGPCVLLPGLMCLRLARGPGWRSDPGIPWKPPVKYNQSINIKDINQRQRNIFQFCEYGGSKTWIIVLSEKFFPFISARQKDLSDSTCTTVLRSTLTLTSTTLLLPPRVRSHLGQLVWCVVCRSILCLINKRKCHKNTHTHLH